MLDVHRVAAETHRSAETVRRWIWSGRLRAHKEGRKLVIARVDLDAMAGVRANPIDLATWIREWDAMRAGKPIGRAQTAADLVLEDRRRRSEADLGDAGR